MERGIKIAQNSVHVIYTRPPFKLSIGLLLRRWTQRFMLFDLFLLNFYNEIQVFGSIFEIVLRYIYQYHNKSGSCIWTTNFRRTIFKFYSCKYSYKLSVSWIYRLGRSQMYDQIILHSISLFFSQSIPICLLFCVSADDFIPDGCQRKLTNLIFINRKIN